MENREKQEVTEKKDLEQVNGGELFEEYCPFCKIKLDEEPDDRTMSFVLRCPECGYVSRRIFT